MPHASIRMSIIKNNVQIEFQCGDKHTPEAIYQWQTKVFLNINCT